MATSHGGLLYYVVQVPKEERLHTSHGYLEETHMVTSTPKQPDRSTDSGWDNPFRPDGDLSREADEIVELIKGGKPITPTEVNMNRSTSEQTQSPPQPSSPVNGSAASNKPTGGGATNAIPTPVAAVELKRDTVAPSDASQVEHVVLKKKPKCACCVIQ